MSLVLARLGVDVGRMAFEAGVYVCAMHRSWSEAAGRPSADAVTPQEAAATPAASWLLSIAAFIENGDPTQDDVAAAVRAYGLAGSIPWPADPARGVTIHGVDHVMSAGDVKLCACRRTAASDSVTVGVHRSDRVAAFAGLDASSVDAWCMMEEAAGRHWGRSASEVCADAGSPGGVCWVTRRYLRPSASARWLAFHGVRWASGVGP